MRATLVDAAINRPNACVGCQGQTGPFIDLNVERGGEHLYVCHRCVREIFAAYEYVPADVHEREMERLNALDARATSLACELAAAQQEREATIAERDRLAERNEELVQERAANDAFIANLQAGPSAIDEAKADIPKPPERKKAPANA